MMFTGFNYLTDTALIVQIMSKKTFKSEQIIYWFLSGETFKMIDILLKDLNRMSNKIF